jgi:serine/threonine-protein kinase
MTAPLPVITTHRLERRERGYLAWVTVANEVADLPLESPPIDASTHLLEIDVDGYDAPLVVLAEPLGAPTGAGFPLRLRPLHAAQERALRAELFAAPVGGRRETPLELAPATEPPPAPAARVTEHHALALANVAGPATLARRAPGSLRGRALADGRFVLEELLGGGGSGEVYRAFDGTLRRAAAVKVLHPALQQSQEYCTRFYGEALAASRLDHRNVLRVLDYGQEADGVLFIVMELLEGESLQQIVDREGRLPLPRLVDLAAQACAGLAHAHDAGVIHRDIKPENIVIVRGRDDDGRLIDQVKVCDFGIAHWTQPAPKEIGDDDATLITRPDPSKIVGTPLYMSPEQIHNDAVDARTDVYALGVVLYELATGRVPFLSDDTTEILTAHLIEAPVPPRQHVPELSPALERVILRALEKEPERRHRDMRELRAELRRLVADAARGAPNGKLARAPVPRALLAPDAFATDPAAALAAIERTSPADRPPAYRALAEALAAAIRARDASLARGLAAWLEARVADGSVAEPERGLAQQAIHVLRDPEVVRGFVVDLLASRVPRTDDALVLVRAAGALAAHAAISARREGGASLEVRGQFVSILRAVGAPALAVIVAALEPLVGLASRQEETLAEDLLRGIADAPSDAAGDVTVRFVRLDRRSVGLTALRTTIRLWGARAQPLLLGVLDTPDDAFRLVAVEELRRLGCVDDAVVDRLGRIVTSLAGDELKLAAASALAAARPEARPRAVAFLLGRLAPASRLMGSLRLAPGGKDDPPLAAALARSLFELERDGSRSTLERLAAQRPELRPAVEAILGGR